MNRRAADRPRHPSWIKVKLETGEAFNRTKRVVQENRLHTVCEEARCPNRWECWNQGTATFMILGGICTRSCGFCSVWTGRPEAADPDEPRRVGEAVKKLGIRHAVVTSVNRDELEDGGAEMFVRTVAEIRKRSPDCLVELLIPDFQGSEEALSAVVKSRPDVLNHNLETVPRLYSKVRPQAKYTRSIELLSRSKRLGMVTKTGVMVGLGETENEVEDVMKDLRSIGCDILTIGQYLQPTREHLTVVRYYRPEEFERLKAIGLKLGIPRVESGPLVRSSYHAAEQAELFK